jgi:TPR repeat protein
MGRALLAKHNVNGARHQLELALSRQYRVAPIDLAWILQDQSAGPIDPTRAAALYERAWRDTVPIGAFELGRLYEKGVSGTYTDAPVAFRSNLAKAWFWYQKGANVGEPNSLARFAERDESYALAEHDPIKRNALLLRAFSFYAAAAQHAHDEDWPEDAWRNWRYRRATLARLLSREGMMQQVADAYQTVRDKWAPHPPTTWQIIKTKLHL